MASVVLKNGSDRDFSRYLREFTKFPMLPAEQEVGLACRSRDYRDVNVAHGLVTSRLRLVTKIAAGGRGHGQRFGEWIADTRMGTIQAGRRFDPDRGFRLASYAMRWIRAAAGHGLSMPLDDGKCRGQQNSIVEREAPAVHQTRLSGAAQPASGPTDARGS
jgi:DNA-directed RNA polymerase sigma subunit (sigma70/sigma32)